MIPALNPKELRIQELAERYRGLGYAVVVRPKPSDIPIELYGYEPDMLAQKPNENLLFEILAAGQGSSVERLREIAEDVSRNPGWKFLFSTTGDENSGVPNELASWDTIRERAGRSGHLIDIGETDAAFLSLWSTLEGMLRRRAREEQLPIDQIGVSALIKNLYSMGELSLEQYRLALADLETRNRLVHGFETPIVDAAALQALVDELLHEWMPAKVSA